MLCFSAVSSTFRRRFLGAFSLLLLFLGGCLRFLFVVRDGFKLAHVIKLLADARLDWGGGSWRTLKKE